MTTATLIQDKNNPSDYRVEAIDDDGGCEVAIFSGPNALERAIAFAGTPGGYYEAWADPENLAAEGMLPTAPAAGAKEHPLPAPPQALTVPGQQKVKT